MHFSSNKTAGQIIMFSQPFCFGGGQYEGEKYYADFLNLSFTTFFKSLGSALDIKTNNAVKPIKISPNTNLINTMAFPFCYKN